MTRRDVNSCCSNAKSNRAFKTVAATVKSSLTRLRSKSLHSIGVWEINGGMKVKILTCAVVVGCMLGGIAFGQTLTITGTICSCDSKQLTVQEGTHYYTSNARQVHRLKARVRLVLPRPSSASRRTRKGKKALARGNKPDAGIGSPVSKTI